MAYLQQEVDTHGVPELELSRRWDLLSPEKGRATVFVVCASDDDAEKLGSVVLFELGYLSERCSRETLQKVVDYLAQNSEDDLLTLEGGRVV